MLITFHKSLGHVAGYGYGDNVKSQLASNDAQWNQPWNKKHNPYRNECLGLQTDADDPCHLALMSQPPRICSAKPRDARPWLQLAATLETILTLPLQRSVNPRQYETMASSWEQPLQIRFHNKHPLCGPRSTREESPISAQTPRTCLLGVGLLVMAVSSCRGIFCSNCSYSKESASTLASKGYYLAADTIAELQLDSDDDRFATVLWHCCTAVLMSVTNRVAMASSFLDTRIQFSMFQWNWYFENFNLNRILVVSKHVKRIR